MNKYFSLLLTLILVISMASKAYAVTFEEVMNTKKPSVILLYASWADNLNEYKQVFSNVKETYGDKYNFIELDIASKDAKFYNDKFYIYPKLPYIVLFKEQGRISRYLPASCALDESCFNEKLKFFAN